MTAVSDLDRLIRERLDAHAQDDKFLRHAQATAAMRRAIADELGITQEATK